MLCFNKIIEASFMYVPYLLYHTNGILPMHDYSHPNCYKKRLVILRVLVKLNPNFATQLAMDCFESRVIHELMVKDEKCNIERGFIYYGDVIHTSLRHA